MQQATQGLLSPAPDHWEHEESHDPGGCIAVDANPYNILLTFTASDGTLIDTLEAKPHQLHRVSKFVRQYKRNFPELYLTGARHDRWPPGLLPVLTIEFGPVRWVSDFLLKHTLPDFRRTTRCLKFLRAMFLATCAHNNDGSAPPITPAETVDRWKRIALEEVSSWLAVDPFDNIPF